MHSPLWQHLFSSGVGIWMKFPQIHHLGSALFTGPGCGSSSLSSAWSLLAKSRLPLPLFIIRMSNRLRCPSSKSSMNVWFSNSSISAYSSISAETWPSGQVRQILHQRWVLYYVLLYTSISSLAFSISRLWTLRQAPRWYCFKILSNCNWNVVNILETETKSHW